MIYETITQAGVGITIGPARMRPNPEDEEHHCYVIVLSKPEGGTIVIMLETDELLDLAQAIGLQAFQVVMGGGEGEHIHMELMGEDEEE